MGIQALPDTTVRAIGATQVLTDPSALVKELVDNALDAHATSISIEIHHNTLDTIQVRDNGHGVAPEDRPLVARRYCTSKLSNFDDLKDIGGSSLGFRGEALASAAELSGSLTISTHIEGEQVGAALKINQKGEVVAQERASLPVGTCVKITDFIKTNPVRRQHTLKNADACLKKIKRCLQAYAFARPHVRYSLRVLKTKNAKGDWVYAPKVNGNAEDAAIKLVGSACSSQCLWSVLEHEGFSFQAFNPRPDADATKIGGFGSFISVDARPVNATRGHFKQIVKAYREALKGVGSNFEDVKEPFLYLEIGCPKDAYDVNVEPAKDDVMFEDAFKVVEGMRKLFNAVYAPPEASAIDERSSVPDRNQRIIEQGRDTSGNFPDVETRTTRDHGTPVNAVSDGFHTANIVRQQVPSEETEDAHATSEPRRTFRTNMYGCDDEDLDLLGAEPPEDRTVEDLAELREARKNVTVSNPWVLAKLNSSVRRPDGEQSLPEYNGVGLNGNVLSSPTRSSRPILDPEETALPTPRPSSPPPPNASFHPSDHVPNMRLARNGNILSQPSVPPPQMYTPMPSSDVYEPEDMPVRCENVFPNYNYGLTSHSTDPPSGTPLDAIPDISARPRRSPRKQIQQSRLNKPFVQPPKDQVPRERVWFDHLEGVERRPRPRPTPRNNDNGMVVQGDLGDFIEDARPLTPPRRNRDIRDFVGAPATGSNSMALGARRNHGIDDFVGGPATGSNSTPLEARLHSRDLDRNLGSGQEIQVVDGHEVQPRLGLAPRGFVRATEVLDLTAENGLPEKPATGITKRRKTSERRALQDLSANAPLAREAEEDQEYRPTTNNRTPSRRRSSHKLGRTKSSKLPLERTPAGQAMQTVVSTIPVSIHGISQFAGKIDEEHSLLGFNQPALEPDNVFSSNPTDLNALTNDLHDLLVKVGSDSDIPTPDHLFRELQDAFAKRSAAQEGDDEIMSSV